MNNSHWCVHVLPCLLCGCKAINCVTEHFLTIKNIEFDYLDQDKSSHGNGSWIARQEFTRQWFMDSETRVYTTMVHG